VKRLFFLLIVSVTVHAQNITRVEYFFDTDPGFGNGIIIPVTAAPDLTRDFTVPLNTVANGFHKLYIRAKSSAAHWSIPQSQLVFVYSNTATFITRLEYFFDTDPGFGNGITIPITAAIDVSKDFTIPLTTISSGFHTVHLRAKNISGQWSLLTTRTVFVQLNTQSNAPFPLKKIEYFLDADPGFGNGISISVSTAQIDQTIVADLSSVSPGFHILVLRSQDINNQWSLPFAKPFFASKSGANIVALEYYYYDGTSKSPSRIYNGFPAGKDVTIDFAAVLDGLLPNTSYEIHVTAINADGQRSDETVHTFVTPAVICDPITPPSISGGDRCGNGSISLTATGATGSQTYSWYASLTSKVPITGTSGNTYTTPSLSATTTYYVSIVNGTCESTRIPVTATIKNCNLPPIVTTTSAKIVVEGIATIDLFSFISDPDNNLDLASLRVAKQPTSGAPAVINNTILTIDYAGVNFVGTDQLTIEVCDLAAACTQQIVTIEVDGEIVVYNAISPNGDSKNESFFIQYIDLLPSTQNNRVTIYNRWGDEVFNVIDYNNKDRVFRGLSTDGSELPTGTYFYKIEFSTGAKIRTGFISLKK
jgi:gliding motility-associated-like protein